MEIYNQISSNKRNSFILLILIFFILIGIGYFVAYIFNMWIISIIISIFAIFYILMGYFKSDKIVLATSGAKKADPKKHIYLINTVEGLALAAGIPKPDIYVIEDPAPNAFATGRNPENSAVAVTTGLLKIMNREELEGVIAHELSHIKNYDIRFMTMTVVMVGLVTIIGNIAARMLIFSGGRNRKGGNIYLLLIGVAFIILAPIFAILVRFAISRKREYMADASGALLTRYPPGLANALKKLKNSNTRVKTATDATAPLFISSPLKKKKSLSGLFATHPPLDERIEKLNAM